MYVYNANEIMAELFKNGTGPEIARLYKDIFFTPTVKEFKPTT